MNIGSNGKSEPQADWAELLADRRTGGALALTQVPGVVAAETGVRPHRATVWRWVLRNALASYSVGGRRMTTKRAVLAFLATKRERASATRSEVEAAGLAAAARIASVGGR